MRIAELVAERLLVHSGSNRSGHRAADYTWRCGTRRWCSSGADERLAARDPAASVARLVTAQCALDCSLLEWRFGRRREPDAARESARARRRASLGEFFFSGEGRVYSSASGGARNTMIAARSPRPNVGKK